MEYCEDCTGGWYCEVCHQHICCDECPCGRSHNCPCDCAALAQWESTVDQAERWGDHG